MKKEALKYYIAFIPIIFISFFMMLGIDVNAKVSDSNDTSFVRYGNETIKIRNLNNEITSVAKYMYFNTIQNKKNNTPIFCNGVKGYGVTDSDVCYYNTKGKGYQANGIQSKTGYKTDSSGRMIFNSLIYGKTSGKQFRLYFPISEDKLYTDAIGKLFGNRYLKKESQNFKYYGIFGDGTGIGYRWWSVNSKSYCYYKSGKVTCTTWSDKTPAQIRKDASGSPYYLTGNTKKGSETGEYRYLGYSSYGDLFNNALFPDDYPTTSKFRNYDFLYKPYSTLAYNGWLLSPTNIDNDLTLKLQSVEKIRTAYSMGKTKEYWKDYLSMSGNVNYDPLVATAVQGNKQKYRSAVIPSRVEAVKDMSVKSIKVCQGEITDINKCVVVGEWNANGSNYYANGSITNGSKELVYGQKYTVFTKLTNNSTSATSINGTATVGEGGGVDSYGNVTLKSTISGNQNSKIKANSDSSWIAMKPFTAGQQYMNGYETVVSGVSSKHIDSADDNDISDNYGALKFKVVPAGNMEIIQIKAYDVDDVNNSKPLTQLQNGKEYKFIIDTKFTPTIKGWTSFTKVIMPLNVTIDRVFTNGSSEHNTQLAYPNGSAYQTLSERTYQYTVYGTAGMPGTDVKVTAEFTKDNSYGFNKDINSKDKVSATYQIPTIKADVLAKGPIYAIDKNGQKYSTESNSLDSSKTYKLVYQTYYNGDVIKKETTPIKTNYSCYYTEVNSTNAKVACNNLQGLVESGSVNSAYVVINGTRYNLSRSGNTWYSASMRVSNQANIDLYVNDSHRGIFKHNLSSPVYRGAGYPVAKNVEVLGTLKNSATGSERQTKSYFNIDFAKVAQGNGRNVLFESTTSTYYGLPMFNHEFWYRTDNNQKAKNAQFNYADMNGKTQQSRVNNLNTNTTNDTYRYRNNVNLTLTDVTIYPGKEEILEGDSCPVYEIRYNIRVTENSVLKNAQGLVTTQVKFAGKTYYFSDYLVEGDNKGISHVLNDVDCSKIDDGREYPAEVIVNPDNGVNETTHNDNKGKDNAILEVVDKDKPTVEDRDKMDVSSNLGYNCDTTSNTISWTESHTVRNWKETQLGDISGFTSTTTTVSKTYRESYKITEVNFSSKDTDWEKVNLLTNPDAAKIKAGYGFKLDTKVEYDSNLISNNSSLNPYTNKSNGNQVSNINIESYLPSVMYAKYNGTTYALYANSRTVNGGKVIITYSYKGKYNGKDTNKIFTDVDLSDGRKTISVSTPRIIGIPTHLNKCLRDSRNVNFTVEGSMYDDMNSHITQ